MGQTKKRLFSAALAAAMMLPVMSSAMSVTSLAAEAKVVNLNQSSVFTRTQEEIKSRFMAALPEDSTAAVYTYAGTNQNGNYTVPVLTETAKQNVLKVSNYYRWLAGLSGFTLNTDEKVWDYAAKGSVLLSVSNFSHTPDQPADMNDSFYKDAYKGTSTSSIARANGEQGMDALLYTLRLWLDDDGFTNPGHRNTFLTRNGYLLAYGMYSDPGGYVNSCQTVGYDTDPNPSGKSRIGNDEAAYAWPAPGNFPADDLSVKAPWSINFNFDKLKYTSLSDLKVTIKDNETGVTDTRTSGNGLYDTTYWGRIISFDHPTVSVNNYLGKSYTVTVTGLKDSSGAAAQLTYDVNFFSYYSFENTSYLDSYSIKPGEKVVIHPEAKGASGTTTFTIYYKMPGSSDWSEWASTSTPGVYYSTTLSYEGKYSFKITATDSAGNTADKILDLVVAEEKPQTDPLVNNSGIDKTTIDLGQSVNITGAASGGSGNYSYAYYFKKSSKTEWQALSDGYTTETTAKLKPGSAVPYDIMVVVKDSNGTIQVKNFTVKINNAALTNKTTISAKSIKVGEKVVLKGAAIGGTAPYKYAFYYKKCTNSEWLPIIEPYTTKSIAFRPTTAIGYDVKAVVRDATGTEKEVSFTVSAYKDTLSCTATVSAQKVKVGEKIVIKGSATGGTAPYKYAFYFKKSKNSEWIAIGTPYTSKSAALKPGSATAYDIKVVVKDYTGTTKSKTFSVTAVK